VTVPTGMLFVDDGKASVKARYVNVAGLKVGDLVSENVSLSVPEPATALLLAHAAAARRLWRRRRASEELLG